MGLFGPRHDILELSTVPREKGKLAALIGRARYQKRKRTLMSTVSVLLIIIGVVILLVRSNPSSSAGGRHASHIVFLPFVTSNIIRHSQGVAP